MPKFFEPIRHFPCTTFCPRKNQYGLCQVLFPVQNFNQQIGFSAFLYRKEDMRHCRCGGICRNFDGDRVSQYIVNQLPNF